MDMVSTQNVRVLVVDPDLSGRVANLLLSKYEVVIATTGGFALQILLNKQHGISVVVTDLYLPDMPSIEFLKIVEKETRLPVVMISDTFDQHLVMHGLSNGAMMFLLKPLCQDDIKHFWQFPIVKNRGVICESSQPSLSAIPEEPSSTPVIGSRQFPHVILNNNAMILESSNGSQRNGKRKIDDMQSGPGWPMGQTSASNWTHNLHRGFVNIAQHSAVFNASPSGVAAPCYNVPSVATNLAANTLQQIQMYFSTLQQVQSQMVHPFSIAAIAQNPAFMMGHHMGQVPNNNYGQAVNNNFGQAVNNIHVQAVNNNYVQAVNNNYGQAPNNNYGQAVNNNYGQVPNNNYGQAVNNNYGQAPNNNYGQAVNNNYGQSPNNNHGTVHTAQRESVLTVFMRDPYCREQLKNIVRGSISRWAVQYGTGSSVPQPPLASTTVFQGAAVATMSVPIALANEIERYIYIHLNARYGQPRGFMVPLPQRIGGNGEPGPSFVGSVDAQAVLDAMNELLNN